MKKMIVKFRPDGTVEMETKGFVGKACMEFAKPFKELLGDVVEERKTSEYYRQGEKLSFLRRR